MDRQSARWTANLAFRAARIWSGLFLLGFVTSHLLNLSLGLISIDAMDAARPYLSGFWSGPVVGIVLILALFVHYFLGLRAIYQRPTLRTNAQDMVQLVTGVLVVPLLATHAIGIAMVQNAGVDMGYAMAVRMFWLEAPTVGLLQVIVLTVVWLHGAAGLFTWLRSRDTARHVLSWLYPLAVAIPIVALLGYAEAGRAVLIEARPARIDQADQAAKPAYPSAQSEPSQSIPGDQPGPKIPVALIKQVTSQVILWSLILGALPFAARTIRLSRRRTTGVRIIRAGGDPMRSNSGLTLLDGFRRNDQPHASLCEGRGRCGTCAVLVTATEFPVPGPDELERRTLYRIGAPDGARLACQLTPPGGQIEVEPLYRADYSFHDDKPRDDEPLGIPDTGEVAT